MRAAQRNRRPGVLVLKMIFVLGLVLLLLAMMAPAVARVREAAAETQSINNLKQLGLAMHNFHDVYNSFPPAIGTAANQQGPAHFHILPFIEQAPLFQNAEGASWKNGAYGQVINVFLDPRDETLPGHVYRNWLATTNYPVNWMIAKEGKVRLQNIPDGTSNTFMFAQRYQSCNGQPTAWGYPSIYTWAPIFAYYSHGTFQSAPTQDRCDPQLPQSIGRDILTCFCDGSVRRYPVTTTPLVWYCLCDPADGLAVPID
jgi:hypothetical protein